MSAALIESAQKQCFYAWLNARNALGGPNARPFSHFSYGWTLCD